MRRPLWLFVLLAATPLALVASVTLPHTFSNGQVADAGEMNANFATLASAIDAVRTEMHGVTRACPGFGTQTYDGPSGTWSTCPASWSCVSAPTHAGCVSASTYASCNAIRNDAAFTGTNGLYWIDPDGAGLNNAPLRVYCDMSTDGGGWTLILRTYPSSTPVWGQVGAVGTLVAPDQASSAKLADAVVRSLNYTLIRARGDGQPVNTYCEHDTDSPNRWESNTNTHTRRCAYSLAAALAGSWGTIYAANNNTGSYHWIDTHDTVLDGCYGSCGNHMILHHSGYDSGSWFCINGNCDQNRSAVAWVR